MFGHVTLMYADSAAGVVGRGFSDEDVCHTTYHITAFVYKLVAVTKAPAAAPWTWHPYA